MASAEFNSDFHKQLKESRNKIRTSFKSAHEALQVRETSLLSRIDRIEKNYNLKTEEFDELNRKLNDVKLTSSYKLKSNKVTDTDGEIQSAIEKKIKELQEERDTSIAFDWDELFECDVEKLGRIQLNGPTSSPPYRAFPPHVKPIVPDYKAKRSSTASCCGNPWFSKRSGDLNTPCSLCIHYLTGNISDPCVFVYNSEHDLTSRLLLRHDGKQLNNPLCFDVDRNYNLIISDYSNHCVYVFSQEGSQIHKFGKMGLGDGEFHHPFGVALDNAGHIILVCQKVSNCLQFF